MTPFHMEILLHHLVSPSPWPRMEAQGYEPFAEDLVKMGLLESTGSRDIGNAWYRSTDKATAWVCAALNTPLPVMKWIIPAREDGA